MSVGYTRCVLIINFKFGYLMLNATKEVNEERRSWWVGGFRVGCSIFQKLISTKHLYLYSLSSFYHE